MVEDFSCITFKLKVIGTKLRHSYLRSPHDLTRGVLTIRSDRAGQAGKVKVAESTFSLGKTQQWAPATMVEGFSYITFKLKVIETNAADGLSGMSKPLKARSQGHPASPSRRRNFWDYPEFIGTGLSGRSLPARNSRHQFNPLFF